MNDYRAYVESNYNSIYHHGIKGQRWGVRNGPPYPLGSEDHSVREIIASKNPENYTYKRKRTNANRPASYQPYIDSQTKKLTAKNIVSNAVKNANPVFTKIGNVISKGRNGISKHFHDKKVKRYMKNGMTKAQAEREATKHDESIKRGIRNAMIASGAAVAGYAAYKLGRHWFKRNRDITVKAGSSMKTLSYDVNRMKTAKEAKDLADSMYYTNIDKSDYAFYNTFFNSSTKVGNRNVLKFTTDNKALRNIKIASEKSGEDEFLKLYRSNKGFRNYINNKDLMSSTMPTKQRNMKEYKAALKTLDRINKRADHKASDKEVRELYKLYNYHLGASTGTQGMLGRATTKEAAEAYIASKKGNGFKYSMVDAGNGLYSVVNDDLTDDIRTYKNLFFGRLKDRGYGGVLDINDAMYGRFKANSPIIVFDNSAWVTKSNRRVRMNEKKFDTAYTIGRKSLPVTLPAVAGIAAYTNATKDSRENSENLRNPSVRNEMTNRARSLYNSGLSQEEIAARLGISVSTVNSMLNR
jgi:predicted transcriptional regulator